MFVVFRRAEELKVCIYFTAAFVPCPRLGGGGGRAGRDVIKNN